MKVAACCLMLLATLPVHAEFSWADLIGQNTDGVLIGYYTGEDVFRRGRDSFTIGYVAAVHDATWGRSPGYCVPDGVKTGQLTDVAWRFLEQNPQHRHLSASFLVLQSFRAAWPCARN